MSEQVSTNDSPRRKGAQHPEELAELNVSEACSMVTGRARKYTRQCPLDSFWGTYVEEARGYKQIPEPTLARIVSVLRERKVLNSNGRWKHLASRPKVGKKSKEDNFYKGLEPIFESVIDAASAVDPSRFSHADRTTSFACRPNCQTASEVPGAAFRVDALNYLVESSYSRDKAPGTAHNCTAKAEGDTTVFYTADAGATYEFKKVLNDETALQNEKQTLGTAEHMVYNDIRREAHFSFTIEGSSARMWCHTRSHTIISRRFDIHKDATEFVKFILFSSFASEYELGFDPNVSRVYVENKLHYEFKIRHLDGTYHRYRTVKVVHENPAAELHSRAMRVFKAVECDTDDVRYIALRDYWLFDDAPEEVQIQLEILTRLEASISKEDYEALQGHFMTILADGVVVRDEASGIAPGPPEGAEVYEYANGLNPKGIPAKKPSVQVASRGATSSFRGPERPQTPPRLPQLQLHGRKHCRTVYAEYCEDLWRVNDPARFYYALYQVMFILDKWRRAGYLHRDISLGNIMLHLFNEKASGLARYITKISDLEYARPYGRMSQHDPITGTSLFMAVELQAQKHLWANNLEEDTLTHHYFVHNPLHDVEAVIWMAIYFAIRRCSRRVFEATEWTTMREILKDVEAYSATIFVHSIHGSVERQNLIFYARAYQKLGEKLKRLHGDDTVFVKLIDAIEALRATYKAVENSRMATPEERSQLEDDKVNAPRLSIDVFHQYAGIYETLRQIFDAISQHFADGEYSDPLIKISDIDPDTGEIVPKPAEPESPPVTVVDDAAPAGDDGVSQEQAGVPPKKLTGKRKNTDEGEAEARDEKHASKRSCQDAAGSGGPSGSTSKGRKTRNARPPAQPTRQSKRLSKRKSDADAAQG
ncbi:hypothetical protein K523DRAFT_245927 [Schizophyllum commune Tattone D]|nr:hypothetical protein K523DRAFT_245927 [Schizophyllum commune Tattone D]